MELCAGIPEGGTTPSYGEIAIAREVLAHTRLHVIIRPRGGDFLYSDIEIRTMLKDIEIARKLGLISLLLFSLSSYPFQVLPFLMMGVLLLFATIRAI